MPIQIHLLTPTDIPTFVRIELAAFASHPRIPMLWPRGYTPDLYAYMERCRREDLTSPGTSAVFVKAVDEETGEIVGASQFTVMVDDGMEEKGPMAEDAQPPADWPEGGNWALKRFFAIKSHYLPIESFSNRPYIQVDLLLVHPSHQHRGIGTQLLAHALQEADERGVPVGLESTPAGLGLYKRMGFKEAKVIKADMRQFGWEEEYDPEAAKRVWMVREGNGIAG